MAPKARVQFIGELYDVLDHDDRREEIFRDDADRSRFLETRGEVCARTGGRDHDHLSPGDAAVGSGGWDKWVPDDVGDLLSLTISCAVARAPRNPPNNAFRQGFLVPHK